MSGVSSVVIRHTLLCSSFFFLFYFMFILVGVYDFIPIVSFVFIMMIIIFSFQEIFYDYVFVLRKCKK